MAKKAQPATPPAPMPASHGAGGAIATVVTTRESIEAIEAQPAKLQALRDAYRRMQALSGTDNRSWIYWAGVHGFPQWMCWHHGRIGQGSQRPYDLFLPWHRAYLIYFEHSARDQVSSMALPWWDWTSATSHTVGVPASFSAPSLSGGADNPLFAGPVPPAPPDPARTTQRFPGPPSQLPTTDDVEQLLKMTSFVDFTAQLQDIHDMIHPWTGGSDPTDPSVGGDMGSVATSAYDPIFWSHHCMIDRIWYLWQLRQGMTNIPPDYLNRPLAPFNYTVADVLDPRALGYEYAVSTVIA